MSRIIFVTRGGPYNDEYEEGSNRMMWKGQNCGKKDSMVIPGTIVYYRNNNKRYSFRRIGTITNIICTISGDATKKIPSTYLLDIELYSEILEISRAEGDRTTHQSILRFEGHSIETIRSSRNFPHGIY